MSKKGEKREEKGVKREKYRPYSRNAKETSLTSPSSSVLGIDPGLAGYFVVTDGIYLEHQPMVVTVEKRIDFTRTWSYLDSCLKKHWKLRIYLERAVPMAMGAKGAFSYGRNFEALVLAIERLGLPFTLVEPGKWTKEMHQGISSDLKPKAKSLIAVQRLFPQLVGMLPTKPKGGLHDGAVDALLIAGYGLRQLQGRDDFF